MKYYYTFENECQEIEVKNIADIDEVCLFLYDSFLSEMIDMAIEDIPSRKKSLGFGVPYDLLEEAATVIQERYNEKYIEIFGDDNGNRINLYALSIIELLLPKLEDILTSEIRTIEGARLALDMLQNFLNEGKWLCGLKDEVGNIITDIAAWPQPSIMDGEIKWMAEGKELAPIMWFGVENEEPISCWLLNNPNMDTVTWQGFWFSGYMDFDILWDDRCAQIWAFAECGLDTPYVEFEAVRESCPIGLDESDTTEEIFQKIKIYCLNWQKEYSGEFIS